MLSAFRRIFFPVLLVLGGKWEQWGSLETSKLETRFQNLGKVVGGLPRFGGFEVVFSSFQGDHNLLAQPRNSKLDFRTQKHIPWTQALMMKIQNSGPLPRDHKNEADGHYELPKRDFIFLYLIWRLHSSLGSLFVM